MSLIYYLKKYGGSCQPLEWQGCLCRTWPHHKQEPGVTEVLAKRLGGVIVVLVTSYNSVSDEL